MGQVITLGLENKLRQIRRPKSFPAYSKIHVRIPDFMLNAVEFIGNYCGISQRDVYGYAIQESSEFLLELDEEEVLDDFKSNFKINWINYPYEVQKVKTQKAIFEIENPFIYNIIVSELAVPKKQVFNYMFSIYVQLFINEYNSTPDEIYRMIFPNKTMAKEIAKKNQDLKMLRALNQFSKIDSFSRYDIIIDEVSN